MSMVFRRVSGWLVELLMFELRVFERMRKRQGGTLMATERVTYHRGFGWRPSLPDPRDIPADPTEIPVLPEVDPRGTYMSPIYDQGHLGSCTANAVAAAIDADRLADGQGAMSRRG
jgi:hypothetical protein